MRKTGFVAILCVVVLLCGGPARAGGYDTALAPYPSIKESFAPEVDALLAKAVANAPPAGAFSAAVTWTCESARKLELDRRNFGPFSLRSCPNWHAPPDPGYWKEGTYTIIAQGGDFRIEKPADEASGADWWRKAGGPPRGGSGA